MSELRGGDECPVCNADSGILPGFKTFISKSLQCEACGARVQVEGDCQYDDHGNEHWWYWLERRPDSMMTLSDGTKANVFGDPGKLIDVIVED